MLQGPATNISNSCAVQAACALLMQPLCTLRVVGVVAHVHVRHARRDAGLQHVALCAPLEWPGCMDQQVHILQVWSRIRCVAAGSMCAPCIRGSPSRRSADANRETAAVRTCTFSVAASEAASSMSHCRKRVPFSSGRPSISFSYPAGRRPDSEMSTSTPSCRHLPPLSLGHQDANEHAAAMRLCAAAHRTDTDLFSSLSYDRCRPLHMPSSPWPMPWQTAACPTCISDAAVPEPTRPVPPSTST